MTTIDTPMADHPVSPTDPTEGVFARTWGRSFATLYDPLMARTERRGNAARRAKLLSKATGTVVELGAGTGHNLEHYPPGVDLILTEPYDAMAGRLERRVAASDRTAQVIRSGAESLPLPDDSADTVVSTLVLCTVDDVDLALAEAKRVLRPGGQLLFVEHVAAEDGRLLRWQKRTRNFWHGFACGCHTDRQTEESIRKAGFRIDDLSTGELEIDLPLIRPLIWGAATNGT